MTLHTYNIFEVLTFGPIVAWDKESGTLITVNDVCFSAWTHMDSGYFVGGNTCHIKDIPKVGDCTDFGLVCQVAQDWLHELLATEGDDEPSN